MLQGAAGAALCKCAAPRGARVEMALEMAVEMAQLHISTDSAKNTRNIYGPYFYENMFFTYVRFNTELGWIFTGDALHNPINILRFLRCSSLLAFRSEVVIF